MRQTIALADVHVLARPREVFPRVLASARAAQGVAQATFIRLEQLAHVFAALAVAFADCLHALLWHFAVQVNGQLQDVIQVPANTANATVETGVRASAKVEFFVEGKISGR